MSETQSIGDIGNYYGGLEVKEEDGRYFWGIADDYWEAVFFGASLLSSIAIFSVVVMAVIWALYRVLG